LKSATVSIESYVRHVPRPDRRRDGLEERVLADAGAAAEDDGVVDLLARLLHTVRKPSDDVVRLG
jgi:hypothetical protein